MSKCCKDKDLCLLMRTLLVIACAMGIYTKPVEFILTSMLILISVAGWSNYLNIANDGIFPPNLI